MGLLKGLKTLLARLQPTVFLLFVSVVVVVVVVVVLTLTRTIRSVVTGKAPVTLEWKNTPEYCKMGPKRDDNFFVSTIYGGP